MKGNCVSARVTAGQSGPNVSSTPGRSRVFRLAVVAVAATAVAVTGFPGTAHADPEAVAKAKVKVDQLGMEAAALDQQALDAQQRLDEARKRLGQRSGDVEAQSAKVEQMRDQVGQVALAQFQSRDIDPATQIFLNSGGGDFLNRYSTMQQFTANQNNVLADFQTQQANLGDMKRAAASDVETIDRAGKEITKLQADSKAKVDEAQAELDKLSAEERQRLQDEAAAEQREAEQRAARANEASRDNERTATPTASSTPSATRSASKTPSKTPTKSNSGKAAAGADPAPAPAGSASGRAAQAVAFAKSKVGLPYVYGGTGPSGYDCSGLTGAAWKSAGVSLPRTSQAQYGAGRSVSKGDLQPGDLVFYYSGISHVGIYVGGGQIVHASRPGKPIGYASVDSMPYMGARRVG